MPVSAFHRVAGAVAVAGLTLSGAGAAHAAVDTDCTGGNTIDGASPTAAADIQSLFDASAALVCLSGTLVLSTPLEVTAELTLHGLPGAVIDGNNATRILQQSTTDTLTVENLRFTRGSGPGGVGGAIRGTSLVVRGSSFDHNSAAYGGAVWAEDASVIENSTFSQNSAPGGAGGAVVLFESSIVTDSTFTANTAWAGGALASYGVLTLTGTTFDSNVATTAAGAMFGEEVQIANSTFVDNSSQQIGGLFAFIGTVEQSTFVNNTAADGFAHSASLENVSLRGNIFTSAAPGEHLDTVDVISDLGGNLFSTASETAIPTPAVSTQFGVSALSVFGANTLASNGGPTQTVAISLAGPAVDAVPAGGTLTTDQRGVTRTAISDAGAFEVGARAALAATGVEPAWPAALAAAVLALGAALRLRRRPTRARSLS